MTVPSVLSRFIWIACKEGRNFALLLIGLLVLSAGQISADEPQLVGWGDNRYGQAKFPPKLTDVAAVATGHFHSVALKNDGTVVAWGFNFYGQTNVPAGLADVVAIDAAHQHSVALKSDGTVVAWGNSQRTNVPPGLNGVVSIAAGSDHTIALKDDGTVVAWGVNSNGSTSVPAGLGGVIAIAAAGGHNLALKNDGTVVAWGYNAQGQTNIPVGMNNVVAVAAGIWHSLALKGDGTVVAWGYNIYGQTNVPAGLSNVVAIDGGSNHSVALKNDGTVVAWGRSGSGGPANVPGGLSDVINIAAGGDSIGGLGHSLALKADGTLVAWGSNLYGQGDVSLSLEGVVSVSASGGSYSLALRDNGTVFGWGYGSTKEVPVGLNSVVAIAAGENHAFALKSDGSVVGWGNSSYNPPSGLSGVVAITSARDHSLALKADGTVVAWGSNNHGQSTVPAGLNDVMALAAGGGWTGSGRAHSLALKRDGTVVAWGSNSNSQINVPVGLSGVVAIAAGDLHSLALKEDGTIVAWGNNSLGETNVPGDLAGVVAIAAASYHSLALKEDGTVVAWGSYPAWGPVNAPNVANVVAIAAGGGSVNSQGYSMALIAPLSIDSSPITLNTAPETGSVEKSWELNERTFFASAGSRLTVAVDAESPLLPSPELGYAKISLLDGAGGTVASAESTVAGQTVVIHDVTVPADGTYRVQVRSRFAGRSGHYRIAVWDSASARPLILNQQHLGSIESPGGVEHWTFTSGAGRPVRLDLLNASAGVAFTLRGPGGVTVFEDIPGDSDPVTLPTAGIYTLTAYKTDGAPNAAYSFRLEETQQTDLTVNTPYSGEFSGDREARLFRVTVPAGPLELQLINNGVGNRAELYASRGVPPSRASYDHAANSGPGSNRSLFIPSASAGVWYVLVYADKVQPPGEFSLEARSSGIALSGISISRQASNVPTLLTISGAGFRPGTVVELVSGTGAVHAAASVEMDAFNRLSVSFPANVAPPGVYSVRATLPSGASATLPGAFTILPAGVPKLETKLIMPGGLGPRAVATIYVEYANTGNAPMPAPLLILQSADPDGSDRPILTLDQSRIVQNFWSSTGGLPPGTSHEAHILASGEQPGTLNPGERFQVPVHYVGMLQTDGIIEMEIRYWTENNPVLLNWASRKESLRPPTIDSASWDVVFENFTVGLPTTADYVAMLNNNARYLGRLGLRVVNVDELMNFEMQKAYGFAPFATLEDVTDAAVAAPGLPLELSRRFSTGLSARNATGPFGQGWSTPWQTRLEVEFNGALVKLLGGGGSVRVFSRDTRNNSYFSGPGDTSKLFLVGGAYQLQEVGGTITRFRPDGGIDYVQDTNGNRVTASYNGGSQIVALTHSTGASISLSYNGAGYVANVTDSAGRSVSYAYSGAYLVSATTGDGKATLYTYDTVGTPAKRHALTSVGNIGVTRHFGWDARGRLASTWLGGGEQTTQFGYDNDGRVTVSKGGSMTTLFFEHRGLLAKSVDPLGNITSSEFDAEMRLVRTVLPTGETKRYTWSPRGAVASITDEAGHITRFRYENVLGNLSHLVDAVGNETRFEYDTKGNPLDTVYADQSAQAFGSYNAQGLPLAVTNRRGQTVAFTYTPAGQIDRQTLPDGSYYDYDYDARGNLVQATEHPVSGPDRITTFEFNPSVDGDRLKKAVYPDGSWVEYNYDLHGRRTRMTDSAGGDVRYEYDTLSRLQRIRDASDVILVEYLFNAAGRLLRCNKANGTYTTYTYDAVGRTTLLTNHAANGSANSRFAYAYDSLGRRSEMTTLDGKWTYSYDGGGQLIQAIFASSNPEIPNQDLRYEYDALGNRIATIENGTATEYSANSLHQYTAVGGVPQVYDADGNLLDDGTNVYSFDALDRITSVVTPSGTTTFSYDPFGNLSRAESGSEVKRYLQDPTGGGVVVAELDGSGNTMARNVHGLDLAARFSGAGSMSVSFLDFDAIGNSVGATDASGLLVHSQAFLPFGGSLHSTPGAAAAFGFGGQFGCQPTIAGLVHMGARQYSTLTGRFVSADPLGFGAGGANLYGYAYNDPINSIDPQGTTPLIAAGAVIGAVTNTAFYLATNPNSWSNGREIAASFASGAFHGAIFGATGGAGGFVHSAAASVIGTFLESLITGKDPTFTDLAVGISLGAIPSPTFPGPKRWGGGGPQFRNVINGRNKHGLSIWKNLTVSNADANFVLGAYELLKSLGASAPRGATGSSSLLISRDPNEKLGPGTGPQGWVAADALLPYRINFENIGPGSKDENGDPYPVFASAPAQRVTITDDLEADFDWETFQITDFGWGDLIVHLPPGTSHYSATVPMTYNDTAFEVEVEAGIDYTTGQIFVRFQSLEPDTGLPPDVLTGLLPPEDGTGVGMGHFSYTIRTKSNLPTGTEIRNVAVIQFDDNETIATNQVDPQDASKGTDPSKEALVTLDREAPVSSIAALPATTRNASVTVTWGGTDLGIGIERYDIYVSINGGPWELWLGGTSDTSALFQGLRGNRYGFRSVARDLLGNLQTAPGDAQATIEVEPHLRPVLAVIGKKLVRVKASSTRYILRGSASDPDDDLVAVEVKDSRPKGRKTFRPAKGTARWTYNALLKPGRNSIEARAVDSIGNRSASTRITVIRK